jgi:hypothetical protein
MTGTMQKLAERLMVETGTAMEPPEHSLAFVRFLEIIQERAVQNLHPCMMRRWAHLPDRSTNYNNREIRKMGLPPVQNITAVRPERQSYIDDVLPQSKFHIRSAQNIINLPYSPNKICAVVRFFLQINPNDPDVVHRDGFHS